MTIYTKETIDSLRWPENEWSQQVKKVILPFIEQGPETFITNANTKMVALHIEDLVLPVTVCQPHQHNSYVCSPYTHYVTYGQDEIKNIKNKILRKFLLSLLKGLGFFLSAGDIDKNVIVNNWLVPTNLYPELSREKIYLITNTLKSSYPEHAIVFRSINEVLPQGLYNVLKELHYGMILSREIYLTDTKEEAPFKSRMFKSDLKILNNSDYSLVHLNKASPRLKDLYSYLNLDKYSKCNPQYSDKFIQLGIDSGWMTFKGFEKDEKIDGTFGAFSYGDMMTSPFFGYDLSISDEGLYRQISAQLLLDAKETHSLLHQSSGAGHYKKLRRAKPYFEYTAFYTKHLGIKRRLVWSLLSLLINSFGKKFM